MNHILRIKIEKPYKSYSFDFAEEYASRVV